MARIPGHFLAALILILPLAALAQSYPNKSIRVIVGFAPSGGTDIAARILGRKLAEQLGQTIVIDNRPGAGGTIGNGLAATAPADGYTLLMTANGPHVIAPSLYKSLPYNVFRDYAAISLVCANPYVLVVQPAVPATSVRELIAWLKANPARGSYSSAGNGTPAHLAGELFKSMAGVTINHIPYKGGAPATTDLIGGRISMMFGGMVLTLPYVKAGRLRALATTGATRSKAVPDLPTIAESGLPGYEADEWFGAFAPASTPRNILQKLNTNTRDILVTPDAQQQFAGLGAEFVDMNVREFADFVKKQIAKWANVVKDANIQAE